MIDWTKSMTHTFEYYIVDPGTWKDDKPLKTVISSSINRDRETSTLGSATFDINESVGECYVRTYLVAIQNGVKYKFPLGTHLVQTPQVKFDGKTCSYSVDAYTPLIELKEKLPPIGYSLLKDTLIMDSAYKIARENLRAPVVKPEDEETLADNFVSDPSEDWLVFMSDLIANAKYSFDIDERGQILFLPDQDTASLQPVWTYTDDNCSIIYPDITIDRDLYDIPNVVEVSYSTGHRRYYARVVNDDPNSPTSTVNRGREIVRRITNPSISGVPSEPLIEEYARRTLNELSTVEYTLSYKHGYCPVRLHDCVRFNIRSAGLVDVKAKVIYQDIKCEAGCSVTEKAVFTAKLWG